MSPSLRLIVVLLAWLGSAMIGMAEGPDTTLVLAPGTGNPRNSEGDFIRLSDGRLLLVYTHFTSGAGDHASAHLASRISDDSGVTWSDEDQLVVASEGGMNVMSVSLIRLAGKGDQPGPIALFYLRKFSLEDCRPVLRLSHDEGQSWSDPQLVIPDDENGYYVMNNDRAIQLEGGRLVLPLAQHKGPGMDTWQAAAKILCYTSADRGQSWQRQAVAPRAEPIGGKAVTCQEPGLVPLGDGRLMIYCRTDAGSQYTAHSQDEGATWSQLTPSEIISPRSPATIERIPGSDHLLMIWNNHQDIPASLRGKRTPLTTAISTDQGKTWKHVKNIEENPNGWYCYTALEFVEGHAVLAYCSGDRTENNGLAQTSVTRIPIAWFYE